MPDDPDLPVTRKEFDDLRKRVEAPAPSPSPPPPPTPAPKKRSELAELADGL
jgi:hypothetical protein